MNGLNGSGWPGDGEKPIPAVVLAAMHHDPGAYLDFIRALDRVLKTLGDEPFTPCSVACLLCYPALWPADNR